MSVDIDAAVSFLATHGRLLDRRRLELLLSRGSTDAVLAALDAFHNDDGGYGWGIEPDLRSPESQPAGAMHAFEVHAEVAASGSVTTPRAVELCDWLDRQTVGDGGLPFTVPVSNPAGCSPVWLGSDRDTASLQMTAQVAANAHLVARHDPQVARHPWLARATNWCIETIDRMDTAPHAYELMFAMRFLDAVAEADAHAPALLERLAGFLPASGVVRVEGGTADEGLRPLDLAPRASGPARRLFTADVIDAELVRLAAGQQRDGGWTVEFESASPVAALEWRGYATVAAITALEPETGR
jgi:hypothetical protein